MEDQLKRFLRKAMDDYKRTGKISECFYHDSSLCDDKIIQAHSIQKNKFLSNIEGKVNGENALFTFTERIYDDISTIIGFKPIGKNIASTFFGFCKYHDNALFQSIENVDFDDSDKHCFLHSYRAFAHSYHKKKESLKAFKAVSNYTQNISESTINWFIESTELSIKELSTDKNKLDEIIETENYGKLSYYVHIIGRKIPIACTSIINPDYSYKNKPLNIDDTLPYSNVMITVLPAEQETIIILACFSDDGRGMLLLDELNAIKGTLNVEKAISSLIIKNAENTFFSPSIWNKLGSNGQTQLCKELKYLGKTKIGFPYFTHSKINFFDNRFSEKTSKF